MTTLVFGHKSPDTDSTGSPIIWAWYLNHVHGVDAAPALLGEPNTEALFMLDHWKLDKPQIIDGVKDDQPVVIVDTNNPAELPGAINNADIKAIIDHHKLVGGLETKGPIHINIQPLACTATIMYKMIGDDIAQMPTEIKGAMLTCILSDTLEFRSPTTPPRKTRPSPMRWPRIWASTLPNMPPGCSRPSRTYPPSPKQNCCAWTARNTKWAASSSAYRFWKPHRPRRSSTGRMR